MIYDKLEKISRYYGFSSYLDAAIDFIEKNDLNRLPIGKTRIMGDRVFVNVMEAEAKEESLADFEIHKKYMDIQIDLEGTEVIQIGLDIAGEKTPFDIQKDIGKVECSTCADCIMGPGRFIICMKEEPHKPGIAYSEERVLKKCVVKVLAE